MPRPPSSTSTCSVSPRLRPAHCHGGAGRGVLDAVRDQVREDLADAILVAAARGRRCSSSRAAPARRPCSATVCSRSATSLTQPLEREHLGVDAQLAGPRPRELEQILDQVAEPLALAVDHVELGRLGRIRLGSVERVDVSLDDRERSAQLVRDLADELGPGPLLAGEQRRELLHRGLQALVDVAPRRRSASRITPACTGGSRRPTRSRSTPRPNTPRSFWRSRLAWESRVRVRPCDRNPHTVSSSSFFVKTRSGSAASVVRSWNSFAERSSRMPPTVTSRESMFTASSPWRITWRSRAREIARRARRRCARAARGSGRAS